MREIDREEEEREEKASTSSNYLRTVATVPEGLTFYFGNVSSNPFNLKNERGVCAQNLHKCQGRGSQVPG